jgi:hypothetical protein
MSSRARSPSTTSCRQPRRGVGEQTQGENDVDRGESPGQSSGSARRIGRPEVVRQVGRATGEERRRDEGHDCGTGPSDHSVAWCDGRRTDQDHGQEEGRREGRPSEDHVARPAVRRGADLPARGQHCPDDRDGQIGDRQRQKIACRGSRHSRDGGDAGTGIATAHRRVRTSSSDVASRGRNDEPTRSVCNGWHVGHHRGTFRQQLIGCGVGCEAA